MRAWPSLCSRPPFIAKPMALPQACMTRLWSTPTRDRPTKAIAAPPATWTTTITCSRAKTSPKAAASTPRAGYVPM